MEGNLKGALEQYKKLVAEGGSNRSVTARAMLGLADCKYKLGHTAEAQSTYASVISLYGDQTAIAADARTRLTVLANRPATPLNLNFESGIGQPGSGWVVLKALKDAGYSAEIQHQGCRQNSTCAVVIGSANPNSQQFGNLMQTFDATAYRGKTLRLRAFLKMDSPIPRMPRRCGSASTAQTAWVHSTIWADRPVKSVYWTPAEIVQRLPTTL